MFEDHIPALRLLMAATFLIAGFISGALAGKRRFDGPEFWTIGNYAVAVGALISAMGGWAPSSVSVALAGALLTMGCAAFAYGMRVFHGRPLNTGVFVGLLAIFAVSIALADLMNAQRLAAFLETSVIALACVDLAYSAQVASLPRSRGLKDACSTFFLCGAALGGLRSVAEMSSPDRVLGLSALAVDVSHQAWFILFSMAWTYYQVTAASDRYESELALAVTELRAEIDLRKAAEAALKAEAARDFLTGAANRRKFFEEAARWVAVSTRHNLPLSVVLLDIDDFKLFNDAHGHALGDAALKAVADRISSQLRGEDLLARYGGEEFVILLPETNPEQAEHVADKLCALVHDHGFELSGAATPLKLTCSFGVASLRHRESSIQSVIDRADAAMYHAKRSGKARVSVSRDVQAT